MPLTSIIIKAVLVFSYLLANDCFATIMKTAINNEQWKKISHLYDCGKWTPERKFITKNIPFRQTRQCKQDQSALNKNRTIEIDQARQATGLFQNWVPFEPQVIQDWTDTEGLVSSGTWQPSISAQEKSFTQSRSYSQNQFKIEQAREVDTITGIIRNKGKQQRFERDDIRTEKRVVRVDVTNWVNSIIKDETNWIPAHGNQMEGYKQSREYKKDYQRMWSYVVDGTISTRADIKTLTGIVEERDVEVTNTEWNVMGTKDNCILWMPIPSTQSSNYLQSRECQSTKSRLWSHKVHGAEIYSRLEEEGSKIVDKRFVSLSESVKSDKSIECGDWMPSENTIPLGQEFNQKQQCKIEMIINIDHMVGDEKLEEVTISRIVERNEIRVVMGKLIKRDEALLLGSNSN